jgi:Cd2+/Zn2+-exporting ATPase
MDCSACAIKIENAMKRLPGVSDINFNYATETLALTLDEYRTSRNVIEDKIRGLGYTPQATSGGTQEGTEGPGCCVRCRN